MCASRVAVVGGLVLLSGFSSCGVAPTRAGLAEPSAPRSTSETSGTTTAATTTAGASVRTPDGSEAVHDRSERGVVDPEISLAKWRSEELTLPPAYAPGLPKGRQSVLFPPGMWKAEADDYWSYAFVAVVKETDFDEERLAAYLDAFYDGLIGYVGERRGITLEDPARVEVDRVPDRLVPDRLVPDRLVSGSFAPGRLVSGSFDAMVALTDVFATGKPIDLRARIDIVELDQETSRLAVRVSPRPAADPIWRALDFAASTLRPGL